MTSPEYDAAMAGLTALLMTLRNEHGLEVDTVTGRLRTGCELLRKCGKEEAAGLLGDYTTGISRAEQVLSLPPINPS